MKGAEGTKGSGPSGAVFGEAPAPRSHPSPEALGAASTGCARAPLLRPCVPPTHRD